MKAGAATLTFYAGSTAMLFVGSFLFLLLGYPQLLSYQEQYQLFLFSGDYFSERMTLPGGLADYLSEFVVQFCYVPWIGAAFIALVLTGVQVALASCCQPVIADSNWRGVAYVMSLLPSLMLLYFMGDVNLLMSYPVALLIVLLITRAVIWGCRSSRMVFIAVAVVYPVLYWLAGAVSFVFLLLLPLLARTLTRRDVWALLAIVYGVCIVYVTGRLFLPQLPESQMYFGVNYHRITNMHPGSVFIVAGAVMAVVAAAICLGRVKLGAGKYTAPVALGILAVAALVIVPRGYDSRVMQPLRYDMLVRNERWADIIALAEKQPPTDDFSLQALNLALAKTGQIGQRMFEFDQKGISGLISRYRYDNTTCLVSAEVFWHLGMVNSAFRYNFDLQEAIMNDRKSGRFLKRMAECQIVNGQYRVAKKYTGMLKKSLFYSDWAQRAESLFTGDDRTGQVEAWAAKRAVRYSDEMLYDYDEIEKMLGLLALGSDGRNPLAWDYFNAALLLKGDLSTMVGMYHYAAEMFRNPVIPRNYQEAIAFYWTFGHRDFSGIPYPVSEQVKQSITSLAQVYAGNQQRPEVWQSRFPGHYCVYYLSRSQAADNASSPAVKGSEREG